MWLTNAYTACHSNPYVRGAIKNDIVKRVIINGMTGNNWSFKKYQRFQIIATSKNKKVIMSHHNVWLMIFFQLITKNGLYSN